MKRTLILLCAAVCVICAIFAVPKVASAKTDFIKWVDCNVSADALKQLLKYHFKYREQGRDFDFVDGIAYLATKNGNNFNSSKDDETLKKLCEKFENGVTAADIYAENKYFAYYRSAYGAIFSQYVGDYRTIEANDIKYGVKVCFPLAKGYWYTHYDDFGNSRNFGFKRKHLGHDIMGSVGTPITAVESGVISELGWNRYGGWRIGIRSYDTKRYYYYAHLRKDRPYAKDLKVGDEVECGRVIGYLGNTGYSSKENQNLKTGQPHLHVGLQLIFDDSQNDGSGEIWVDMYEITKFLSSYRASVQKDAETGEFYGTDIKITV